VVGVETANIRGACSGQSIFLRTKPGARLQIVLSMARHSNSSLENKPIHKTEGGVGTHWGDILTGRSGG